MKKLLIILSAAIYSSFSFANAPLSARNYSNAFIFDEQGIEFAVFPDGHFDFNILNQINGVYDSNVSVLDVGFYDDIYISFNTGYRYDAYIQYDDFGAIVQIQNVPVFYDFYGRVRQIGNIHIRYNQKGYVRQVGWLYVNYRPNLSFYCHGYINNRNRFYRQRPWHLHYRRPSLHTAVVYDRPYRRHYTPTRRHYNGPYRNNRRPQVYYSNTRSRTRSNHSLGYTNGNRNENSVTRSTTRRSVNRTNNNINMRNQTPVCSTERTRSTIVRTTTPNRGQYNREPNTRSANVAQLNRRTTTHSVAQNNTRSQQKRTPSRSRKNN